MGPTWGPKTKEKNENGIFGISVSRGVRNVVICPLFMKKNLEIFEEKKRPKSRPLKEKPPFSPPPPSLEVVRDRTWGFIMQQLPVGWMDGAGFVGIHSGLQRNRMRSEWTGLGALTGWGKAASGLYWSGVH